MTKTDDFKTDVDTASLKIKEIMEQLQEKYKDVMFSGNIDSQYITHKEGISGNFNVEIVASFKSYHSF